jgi:hypothetical protein
LVEPQPAAGESLDTPDGLVAIEQPRGGGHVHACPVPIGARESKTTIPTSGRTAMLRESVTSGADELHGRPVASALASMMSEVVEFTA